jgi:hypothetical protein
MTELSQIISKWWTAGRLSARETSLRVGRHDALFAVCRLVLPRQTPAGPTTHVHPHVKHTDT